MPSQPPWPKPDMPMFHYNQTMEGSRKPIAGRAYCLPLRARHGNCDRFDILQCGVFGVTNVMLFELGTIFLLQLLFGMGQCAIIGNSISNPASLLTNGNSQTRHL
ncbi:hypothetical protein VC83_04543 [Pseudogymnoascus destructans]|uniref:Uncharacterized protein n=1 Tax=Pseudogymnoascus destructans TaxID=655981 RepID=A0A177A776_9PEZI|nr:uncharacterized protein VC83_04543 [Pseudogymnoascus destructans]OAF57322.1 hypothetical protein VC83_04543 [Pseudogymnoascus destructans]